MIQSISKLLCAFDILTHTNFEYQQERSQCENEVILQIYGTFEEIMQHIQEARDTFTERKLLSVYQSYLNSFRGFFSGIYTANQFEVLIKRFLLAANSLSSVLSQAVL